MEQLIVSNLSNVLTGEREQTSFDFTGQSILDVIEKLIPDGMKYRVLKNGQLLDPGDPVIAMPLKLKDEVCVVPVVEGDDALKIVAMIVIAVATYGASLYVQGAMTAAGYGTAVATMAGAAAGMAVSIAGGMLLGQWFKPPSVSNDIEKSSTYSWNPVITQAQGVTIQRQYGTLRAKTGNVINSFREPVEGFAPSSLNAMISYGYGPYEAIRDVRVNDQYDSEDYGMVMQRRLGHIDQDPVAGFADTKSEYTPNYALTQANGEFTYPIPAGHDAVELSIQFPQGLFTIDTGSGQKVVNQAEFDVFLTDDVSGLLTYFAGDENPSTFLPGTKWSLGKWEYAYDQYDGDEGGEGSDSSGGDSDSSSEGSNAGNSEGWA